MSEILNNRRVRDILIASSLATAALHTGLEVADLPHGPRVEGLSPFSDQDTRTDDVGTIKYGTPYLVAESTPSTTKEEPTNEYYREFRVTGAQYAREFATDESARSIDTTSVQKVAQSIEIMRQQKYEKIVLKVKGLTSAEDDTQDEYAGVQLPSTKNQDLGVTRRDAFIDQLSQLTDTQDIEIVYITDDQDQYTDENSFTDTQVDTLQQLVVDYGYANIKEIIVSYNQGKAPLEVDAILYEWLDKNRGVAAELIGYKTIPGQEGQELQEVSVCIKPMADFVTVERTTVPHDATLPWGLFLMGGSLALAAVSYSKSSRRRAHQDIMSRQQAAEQRRSKSAENFITGVVTAKGSFDAAMLTHAGIDLRRTELVKMKELLSPAQRDVIEAYIIEQEHATIERQKEIRDRERNDLKKLALGFAKIGIPAVVVMGALMFIAEACSPEFKPKVATPSKTEIKDPCAGADEVRTVKVGTKTVHYQDGRYSHSDFKPEASR